MLPIPDGAIYDILDFRLAGQSHENRWNVYGEPTLYLASDHRVAIADFARHFYEEALPRRGVRSASRPGQSRGESTICMSASHTRWISATPRFALRSRTTTYRIASWSVRSRERLRTSSGDNARTGGTRPLDGALRPSGAIRLRPF